MGYPGEAEKESEDDSADN